MGILDNLAARVGEIAGTFRDSAVSSQSVPQNVPPSAPTSYPLDQYASVTLNGSGNGTASLGPSLPREHWQPGSCFVSVATNTNEASCVLSIGSSPQSSTQVAQTSKGSSGATASLSGDMPSGYKLWATWSGGDVGAQATLHVMGARTVGSPVT